MKMRRNERGDKRHRKRKLWTERQRVRVRERGAIGQS